MEKIKKIVHEMQEKVNEIKKELENINDEKIIRNNFSTYELVKNILNLCLNDNILNITFIKKDNTSRTIKCTNIKNILEKDDRYVEFIQNKSEKTIDKKLETNDNCYLNVWDLYVSDWRKINVEKITKIEFVKE